MRTTSSVRIETSLRARGKAAEKRHCCESAERPPRPLRCTFSYILSCVSTFPKQTDPFHFPLSMLLRGILPHFGPNSWSEARMGGGNRAPKVENLNRTAPILTTLDVSCRGRLRFDGKGRGNDLVASALLSGNPLALLLSTDTTAAPAFNTSSALAGTLVSRWRGSRREGAIAVAFEHPGQVVEVRAGRGRLLIAESRIALCICFTV